MAVYGCVAFVQLWHHHPKGIPNAAYRVTAAAVPSAPDLLADGSASPEEADCPVCSHQFLTYKLDTAIRWEMPVVVPAARHGFYRLPGTASPTFPLPNKGPPCTPYVSCPLS